MLHRGRSRALGQELPSRPKPGGGAAQDHGPSSRRRGRGRERERGDTEKAPGRFAACERPRQAAGPSAAGAAGKPAFSWLSRRLTRIGNSVSASRLASFASPSLACDSPCAPKTSILPSSRLASRTAANAYMSPTCSVNATSRLPCRPVVGSRRWTWG